MDLAVNAGFPDPPGDELGVLGAEVDDQDSLIVDIVGSRHRMCDRLPPPQLNG
jgi:hypothetical protein